MGKDSEVLKRADVHTKENYVYPVRFEKNELGGYDIMPVDFEEFVGCADTLGDAYEQAQELLASAIVDYISCGRSLPAPTDNADGAVYIHIWMPRFRSRIKEVYVRKNVTLPLWLDMLARENNINFSAALVRGIKQELGIISKE